MKGQISHKIFLSIILFGLMAATALAIPAGPYTLNQTSTDRLKEFATQSNQAIAGNVTELVIDTWSVTRSWQGYYGNVSGTIVLADQNNNTLYDWNTANPNGRVYSTRNNNPTWSAIQCASLSELSNKEAQISGTNESDRNGIYPVDAPNLTFTLSTNMGTTGDLKGNNNNTGQYANYSKFWIGPVPINGTGDTGECYSTVMHNSTGWANGQQNAGNDPYHWREIALSDGSSNGVVYAAILETNDYIGFDNKSHDFQMIVPENGHGIDETPTTYYFFVELE